MLLSDLSSSLTACGGDSITFAQLRGRILKELGVDLPTTYLSETYTMGDIVDFVVKGA
jgi:acyl carrier protein